jgi:hypothetical protein
MAGYGARAEEILSTKETELSADKSELFRLPSRCLIVCVPSYAGETSVYSRAEMEPSPEDLYPSRASNLSLKRIHAQWARYREY